MLRSGGKRPSPPHLVSLANDKRGVSEAIAALLMMVIAIAAGTMLYAYSATTFGTAYSQFNDRTSTNEDRAKERFAVLSIWSRQSPDQVNVTVINYGEIDLALDAAYVNGTPVQQFLGGKGQTVNSAKLVNLWFTCPIPIVRGRTYVLIIVSMRGTTIETPWKA